MDDSELQKIIEEHFKNPPELRIEDLKWLSDVEIKVTRIPRWKSVIVGWLVRLQDWIIRL